MSEEDEGGSRKGTEWSKQPGPRMPDVCEGREKEAKQRNCIRCRKPFLSQHAGHRFCLYCRSNHLGLNH